MVAVVRLDDTTIDPDQLAVVQVRETLSEAEAEVERLTTLNAAKGARYVAVPTRYVGRSPGGTMLLESVSS